MLFNQNKNILKCIDKSCFGTVNDHFDGFLLERTSKQLESFLYFRHVAKIVFQSFHRLLMFDIFSIVRYVCSIEYFHQKGNSKKNIYCSMTNLFCISFQDIELKKNERMIDRLSDMCVLT